MAIRPLSERVFAWRFLPEFWKTRFSEYWIDREIEIEACNMKFLSLKFFYSTAYRAAKSTMKGVVQTSVGMMSIILLPIWNISVQEQINFSNKNQSSSCWIPQKRINFHENVTVLWILWHIHLVHLKYPDMIWLFMITIKNVKNM